MSERGGSPRRDRFDGGGMRRDRGGGERRFSPRDARDRPGAAEREAVRRAAQQRPEGGYSLDDFDDIPMPRSSGAPETSSGASEGAASAVRAQDVDGSMRLQKALANAGVASRRVCEQLIVDGKVTVNGTVVTELGSRVHPERDRIEVKGTPVQVDQSMRYVLLNKPTGVVSTMRDEQGRPDLRQFTREWSERLYNVGRLDGETSGLLILTNDGDLANVLAHPSYGVEKTYVAKVRGRVTPQTIQLLLDGFELSDGFIKADRAVIVADQPSASATLVELTLHSGRNRIVRRMLDHVGHPVLELVRRSFGPLHLGTLRAGETRELTQAEVSKLLTLARRAQRRPENADGSGRAVHGRNDRDERRRGRDDRGRNDRSRDDRGRGDRRRDDQGERRPRTMWRGRGPEPRERGERDWPSARGTSGEARGQNRGREDRRYDRADRRDRDDRYGRDDRRGRDDRYGRDDRRGRDDRYGRDDRRDRDRDRDTGHGGRHGGNAGGRPGGRSGGPSGGRRFGGSAGRGGGGRRPGGR